MLEWTRFEPRIIVNGRTCLVSTRGDPAFQQAHIMVFAGTLGSVGSEYAGGVPLPVPTDVDSVKAWNQLLRTHRVLGCPLVGRPR